MPSRLRLPRRFPPTREGWYFLVATLVVGAAAVNGGINLLFLVFGMMIFLILASGILSELCLRDLVVTRRPPGAIHAGAPYLMGIAVRNTKKRVPTFSLEVEDLLAGRPVDRRCYYLKLPAGRVQETAYRNVLARRGRHQLTGFRLSTRFPFGLIRKSRDVNAPAELLVYPALVPVPESLLPGGLAEHGRRAITRPSRSGDFHGLREFRPGDDPRDIHWRTSARRGRPFIREAEDETGKTVVVTLEDGGQPAPAPGVLWGSPEFEAAVSMAASVAVHLIRRGYSVGLAAGGTLIAPAAGATQATHLLQTLAMVRPGATAVPLTPAMRAATRVVVRPSRGAPSVDTVTTTAARRLA